MYRPDGFNPELEKFRDLVPVSWFDPTAELHSGPDGRFRVLGLPGKGYVLVRAGTRYTTADFADWQGEMKSPGPRLDVPSSPVELALNYNAVCVVTGDANHPREYAIKLDPGVALRGTIVDPDGKPVAGAFVSRRATWRPWEHDPIPTAELTLEVVPHRPRTVLVLQPDRHLGTLFRPEAGQAQPFEVRLRPTATATGRLRDPDGRALADAPVLVYFMHPGRDAWSESPFHSKARTDADGRFRLDNLVEGLRYQVRWQKRGAGEGTGYRGFTVTAGEKKDLGDIK